ncbi:hypothetical protein NHX12_030403, partial [Muraenolepis orangiensis]
MSKALFDSPPLSPAPPMTPTMTPTSTPTSTRANKFWTPRGPARHGTILSHFLQTGANAPPSSATQKSGATSQTDRCMADGSSRVFVKEEPQEQAVAMVKMELSSSVAQQPLTTSSPAVEDDVKPVIKVACPVCGVGIPQQFINKHLDSCLTRGQKKESLRSNQPESARKTMGKPVYTLLSMQELKRRLKACHLSVQGPRKLLVRRHQDFVHAYNAQCDSLSPKSAEVIAKEVEANEKTRNKLQGTAKPVLVFLKNQSEVEIDEMCSDY